VIVVPGRRVRWRVPAAPDRDADQNKAIPIHADGNIEIDGKVGAKLTTDGKLTAPPPQSSPVLRSPRRRLMAADAAMTLPPCS
jgi:hypothetical protein